MKVSIALCTYNGEKFLLEQLESFLNQTRLPDELIVCDDCSTDKTIEILNDFKQDSSFSVQIHINQENLGSTKNFEQVISFCAGDIIFLADQDDVWMPEKIQLIENEFEKNVNLGLVFTDADLVDEHLRPLNFRLTDLTLNKKVIKKLAKGKIFECLLRGNIVTGATLAFRSVLRSKITPFPENIPEMLHDGWIAFATVLMSEYKFINKPLVKYRQHDWQQTGMRKFLPGGNTELNSNFLKKQLQICEFLIVRNRRIIKWIQETNDLLPFVNERAGLSHLLAHNAEDELLHCRLRASLSSSVLKRIMPVLKELISGRYHKFSNGFFSMGRDLLKGRFAID